jgi:hypothetical protein
MVLVVAIDRPNRRRRDFFAYYEIQYREQAAWHHEQEVDCLARGQRGEPYSADERLAFLDRSRATGTAAASPFRWRLEGWFEEAAEHHAWAEGYETGAANNTMLKQGYERRMVFP